MSQKMKEYHFDVEMIIDHEMVVISHPFHVSSHRMFRGLKLEEVIELIKQEKVPTEANIKITFNIRGVNY